VSHTCTVRPEEAAAVADFLWEHRAEFSGITVLGPDTADRFPQPPLHAVATTADAQLWNRLGCHPVDYGSVPDEPATRPQVPTPACTSADCAAP
jgi:ribonucleoside-diphosphate reductase alpha chain